MLLRSCPANEIPLCFSSSFLASFRGVIGLFLRMIHDTECMFIDTPLFCRCRGPLPRKCFISLALIVTLPESILPHFSRALVLQCPRGQLVRRRNPWHCPSMPRHDSTTSEHLTQMLVSCKTVETHLQPVWSSSIVLWPYCRPPGLLWKSAVHTQRDSYDS